MRRRDSRFHLRSRFPRCGKPLVVRLFPERQIVLRSGLRRHCFTVSTGLQATVALAVIGTTTWQGVVTTQWLYSAATIAHKNQQIVELRVDRAAAIESKKSFESRFRGLAARISTEVEDIQRNLSLLAHHDRMTSEPIAAYPSSRDELATERAMGPLSPLDEKLARLEKSLGTLRSSHSELLATSAETASVQLDRVESALATVGIDAGALVADTVELEDSVPAAYACEGEGLDRGGPFVPVKNSDATHEAPPEALHATMQRWDDVVVAISQLPLGAPVENMRMSSRFGRRVDPFKRRPAMHAGVDYAALAYSPVLATGGGVVSYSGRKGRYGNLVEISHGHGFFTRYAHLAEISVAVGQNVERGTEIGLVGSTGRSTGPHLHYELRVGNEPRDPLKFIGVGKHVFKRDSETGQG